MTSKEFVIIIEKIKRDKKVSYIDAIVDYCDKHGIDTASVGKLISKPSKEKIEAEARNLNLLQKTGSLPI